MRTTVNIDDVLYEEAADLMGVREKTALVKEGLIALIQRESAKRLALLGGSDPNASAGSRRRSDGTTSGAR